MSDESTSESDRRLYASRIRRPGEKSEQGSVKIVDTENDFPFAGVDFIRIGSAHTVCRPEQDAENAELLQRLSEFVMRRFEPQLLPASVQVERKSK